MAAKVIDRGFNWIATSEYDGFRDGDMIAVHGHLLDIQSVERFSGEDYPGHPDSSRLFLTTRLPEDVELGDRIGTGDLVITKIEKVANAG